MTCEAERTNDCSHWRQDDTDDCVLCGTDLGPIDEREVNSHADQTETQENRETDLLRGSIPRMRSFTNPNRLRKWTLHAMRTITGS
jgi:hypothetical protein